MTACDEETEKLFLRGVECHQFGLFDDAVDIFGEILREKPDLAKVYHARGAVLSDLGRWEDALADFGKAIELDPSDAEAYFLRGNENLDLGRKNEALADYENAARVSPQMAPAMYNAGLALLAMGNPAGAVERFGKAVVMDPALARGYHNRGKALLDLGRPAEALADFEEAIRVTPYDAAIYHNRATALLLLGRLEEAAYDYTTFINRAGPPHASFVMEDQRLLEALGKNPAPGARLNTPKPITQQKIDKMRRETTVFVDICGSTSMVNTYGASHFYSIFSVLERIFDTHATANGRLYKKGLGDGFMGIFSDCKGAVTACVKTMADLTRHNQSAREGRRVNIRIGADFGETAASRDGDRFGAPVNVAKRIEGVIGSDFIQWSIPQDRFPSENRILISYGAFKPIINDPAFAVEKVGVATLRGLDRIQNEIFLVDWKASMERMAR